MKTKKLLRLPAAIFLSAALYAGGAAAIDTPRDLRGTEIRQYTVKWEWEPVSGAAKYEVTVNGKQRGSTRDTEFYSYGLNPGQHSMYVRAIDSDGRLSSATRVANIRVSEKFKYGTHGRSTLGDVVDANSASVPTKSSSNGFGTPNNPRGVEIESQKVRWSWDGVDDAVEYEVTVDGKYAGKTKSTSWDSRSLWIGKHSMTVKAINSSGRKSEQSKTVKLWVTGNPSSSNRVIEDSSNSSSPSSSSSSGSVQVVNGLRAEERSGQDVLWKWNASPNAKQYEVTVDGKTAGITSSTQWTSRDLWKGTHSLTVKAIDSSGKKSEQSDTLKFKVTGRASGSSNSSPPPAQDVQASAPPPPQSNSGDPSASKVKSLIDPASYNYSEVSNKEGYELVFSDEFNGDALNPYRWHSQLRWDGEWNGERYEYRVVNGEDQFYVNVLTPDNEHKKDVLPVYNPFRFNGKHLSIRAAVNPKKSKDKTRDHGKLDDMFAQQQFLSGAISTHEKFSQKYGYFEARIKIPAHEGSFPAFWLFHERRAWEGTQRSEIDIMENLGHAPQYIYNTFHYFKNVSRTYGGDANFIKPKPSGQIFTGIDYSRDFHTYSVKWEPGKVTWYIDGVQTSEMYNKAADFEELYVMLNLAIGGNWTNFPKNAGGLGRPSGERWPTAQDVRDFKNPELEIDYVRVYKRK